MNPTNSINAKNSKTIVCFEDLECWQVAREIVNCVYRICKANEVKKDYGLADQTKRTAISVMANIAEGFSRKGNKEFSQFLYIAKSSAAELQSHLYVFRDQVYISEDEFEKLYSQADKVQRQISNLIKYLNMTLKKKTQLMPRIQRPETQ